MAGGLLDHVADDPAERARNPVAGHRGEIVESGAVDDLVAVRYGCLVQGDDVANGLFVVDAEVGIRVIVRPREIDLPAGKVVFEPPTLHPGKMLDEAEHVGARLHHGASGILLG